MNKPWQPVIFTDLDGTLLDHHTYSWRAAAQALWKCRELKVPVILVSSKTRAEMEPLHHEMGLADPFVSENGGGIFFPKAGPLLKPENAESSGAFWRLTLGEPYPLLRRALLEIAGQLKIKVTGFSCMSVETVSQLTGLDGESAKRAKERDFDEPFVIDAGAPVDISRLKKTVRERGLELSVGGRFFHIHGAADKALALDKAVACYKTIAPNVVSVALGDSQNDFSMLNRADIAYYLGAGPVPDNAIPKARKSSVPGPEGWNHTVINLLEQKGVRGIT